jgi:hypothetical protein
MDATIRPGPQKTVNIVHKYFGDIVIFSDIGTPDSGQK